MSSASPNALLEMHQITKDFRGVQALRGVNFQLQAGEIHALVGENGAGKSTLMKILSGFYPSGAYGGELWLDGQLTSFRGIDASEEAGIAIIHQELALVPHLSIAENIFLGQECRNRWGLIDWDETWSRAQALMEQTGLKRSAHTLVEHCSVGEQQLVEITKALARRARILILDEPTAALTESEALRLLERLRILQAQGVSCIYISHRLHEVLAIAQTITILRDGQTVGTYPREELDEESMIARMVGRDMSERYPRQERSRGKGCFAIRHWSVASEHDGRRICDDITLEAYQGEILGISGLAGSGRSELFMNVLQLCGHTLGGELRLNDEVINMRTPRDGLKHGLALVSEDRKRYGLVLDMDIRENTSLAHLESFASLGLIDGPQEIEAVHEQVRALRIKTPSLEQKVGNLSGGNQQKVVLAKWLLAQPRVLILDEPTRGIDVGARYEIYKIMNQLVDQGVIVIMISSDLPEILGMSDRIVVFHEGRIRGELTYHEATQERIMSYATGRA